MFFATEPEPNGKKSGRLGKYASSASKAVGKGVEKTRPFLARVGSALLTGLRKLLGLATKGLKSSASAVKDRLSKRSITEEPTAAPAAEELQSVDAEPQDEL